MEVWRNVVDYEGVYEVSNFGRVKRVKRATGAKAGRILRPGTLANGAKNVSLTKDSRPRSFTVHRLVAIAFLGSPPSPRHQVAHNDGNPANNRLANLRWATPAENAYDQVVHGTQKGRHYGRTSALTDEQVYAIRADHRPETVIGPEYGLSPRTIGQIRRRQTYKHLPARPDDYVPLRNSLQFTDAQIRDIRKDPRSPAELALVHACSSMTMWAIKTRRTYAHVSDEPPPPAPENISEPEQLKPRATCEVVDGVAMLELTQNLVALLDVEDVPLVEPYAWFARRAKYTHYVMAYLRGADGRATSLGLHRLLMNPPEGMAVDHINGDGLDNRRVNLRIVTVAENNMNSRVRRDSQSGIKGAYFNRKTGNYYSHIKRDGRRVHLGTFATAEEAAIAYARASKQLHGEFGRTHFDE